MNFVRPYTEIIFFRPNGRNIARVIGPRIHMDIEVLFGGFQRRLHRQYINVVITFRKTGNIGRDPPFPANRTRERRRRGLRIDNANERGTITAGPNYSRHHQGASFFRFAVFARSQDGSTSFGQIRRAPIVQGVFRTIPTFTQVRSPTILGNNRRFN